MTIHDRNKELLRRRKEKYLGARDLGDTEADYDSSINYGKNVTNMGLEEQHAPTRKEIKAAVKTAYESNISEVTGQTYNSDPGGDETIKSMPKVIKRKGMDIRIDAPILSDSEAVKRAVLIGLARVAEAISKDVQENIGGEFGDDKPDGFVQGERTGKYVGTYAGASEYYGNKKIPYWRGGLRGSFVPAGQEGLSQLLSFEAGYALTIENGGNKSGPLDGAWVQDKLDSYWQTTKNGWSGEIELSRIHAHPFTAGVAENINVNMERFGYLQVFGTHFVASVNG
jgi:hypothetical protein